VASLAEKMRAHWRHTRLLLALGGVAGFQYLILATPPELVPRFSEASEQVSGGAYRLSRTQGSDADSYSLELFGDVPVPGPGDLTLVGVAAGAHIPPVQPPSQRLPFGLERRYSFRLVPRVPPGTYKIELPGYLPFGLVIAE